VRIQRLKIIQIESSHLIAGSSQLEKWVHKIFLHFLWINYPPMCSQPLNPKISSYATAHSWANIPTTVIANELGIQLFKSGAMWLRGMWHLRVLNPHMFCSIYVSHVKLVSCPWCRSHLSRGKGSGDYCQGVISWLCWVNSQMYFRDCKASKKPCGAQKKVFQHFQSPGRALVATCAVGYYHKGNGTGLHGEGLQHPSPLVLPWC